MHTHTHPHPPPTLTHTHTQVQLPGLVPLGMDPDSQTSQRERDASCGAKEEGETAAARVVSFSVLVSPGEDLLCSSWLLRDEVCSPTGSILVLIKNTDELENEGPRASLQSSLGKTEFESYLTFS